MQNQAPTTDTTSSIQDFLNSDAVQQAYHLLTTAGDLAGYLGTIVSQL